MASIFEGLLKPIQGLLKLLNSPLIIVIVLMIGVLGTIAFVLWTSLKPAKQILYISDDENIGDQMNVKRMAPAHLYSKKGKTIYRFVRFREAINFVIGGRTVTRWLAKVGTAYSKRLESGDVGEFTLYTIMIAVWGQEIIDALKDEEKQKLIESKVMLTVRLEEGTTPFEGMKDRAEAYIKQEEDAEMAKLFGENVRRELTKEDYIKTIALVGSGVALCYIAQAMGLIGGLQRD
jgi:hypothetical protein